jgi:acetyltransferase-like isoleucine patch superfamily enzyme
MKKSSNINRSNIVSGPLSLWLDSCASIGNRNKVVRAPFPSVVCWGACFVLGEGSKITSDHLIDCTRTVRLGSNTIIAGSGSQIWSHGYIHDADGPGRYRIDGKVNIGNNVYLGSRCIINLGVNIAPACIIGAGAVIAKSLPKPGFYVGAGLRILPRPLSPAFRDNLHMETSKCLCEKVYFKY